MNQFSKLLVLCSILFSHITISIGPVIPTAIITFNQTSPIALKHIITHDTIFSKFPKMPLDGAKPSWIPKEISNIVKQIQPHWRAHDVGNHFVKTSPDNTIVLKPEFEHINQNNVQIPRSCEFYTFTPAQQREICLQYQLYTHPGFREFVQSLPEFESFIVGFKNKLWNNQTHMDSLNTQYNLPEVRALFHDGTNSFCSLMCNWFKEPCYKSTADSIGQKVVSQAPQLIADAKNTLQDSFASPTLKETYAQRLEALNKTIANNGIASIIQVELSPAVQDMAQRYDINPAQLQYSYNCEIGNVLHTESVQLIGEAQQHSGCILKPDVEQCALAAIDYTKHGNIGTAMALADVCHVTLDHIKRFGAVLADCTQGVGLGVYDAGTNVASMFTHPVQTAEELVNGLSHVGYYVGKALCRMGYIETLSSLDPAAGLKERIQFINDIKETTYVVTKAVAEKFAATPTREIVRHGTSFLIEGYLTGKTITALGSLCKNAAMLSRAAAGNIKNVVRGSETLEPVAAGVGKIEDLQLSKLQTWFNQIEDKAKKTGGFLGETVSLSQEAIEKSIEWALHDNKVNHVYEKTMHGFAPLIAKLGGEKQVTRAIIETLVQSSALPSAGKFLDIPINVAGYTVVVRGFVHEGIIKIGTMFIPK